MHLIKWKIGPMLAMLALFCKFVDAAHRPSVSCVLFGQRGCVIKCNILGYMYGCTSWDPYCDGTSCDCRERYDIEPRFPLDVLPEDLPFKKLLAYRFLRTPVCRELNKTLKREPELKDRVINFLRTEEGYGPELKQKFKMAFPEIKPLLKRLKPRLTPTMDAEVSVDVLKKDIENENSEGILGTVRKWWEKPKKFDVNSDDNQTRIIELIQGIKDKDDLLRTLQMLKDSGEKSLFNGVVKHFLLKGLTMPDGTEIVKADDNPGTLEKRMDDDELLKNVKQKIIEEKIKNAEDEDDESNSYESAEKNLPAKPQQKSQKVVKVYSEEDVSDTPAVTRKNTKTKNRKVTTPVVAAPLTNEESRDQQPSTLDKSPLVTLISPEDTLPSEQPSTGSSWWNPFSNTQPPSKIENPKILDKLPAVGAATKPIGQLLSNVSILNKNEVKPSPSTFSTAKEDTKSPEATKRLSMAWPTVLNKITGIPKVLTKLPTVPSTSATKNKPTNSGDTAQGTTEPPPTASPWWNFLNKIPTSGKNEISAIPEAQSSLAVPPASAAQGNRPDQPTNNSANVAAGTQTPPVPASSWWNVFSKINPSPKNKGAGTSNNKNPNVANTKAKSDTEAMKPSPIISPPIFDERPFDFDSFFSPEDNSEDELDDLAGVKPTPATEKPESSEYSVLPSKVTSPEIPNKQPPSEIGLTNQLNVDDSDESGYNPLFKNLYKPSPLTGEPSLATAPINEAAKRKKKLPHVTRVASPQVDSDSDENEFQIPQSNNLSKISTSNGEAPLIKPPEPGNTKQKIYESTESNEENPIDSADSTKSGKNNEFNPLPLNRFKISHSNEVPPLAMVPQTEIPKKSNELESNEESHEDVVVPTQKPDLMSKLRNRKMFPSISEESDESTAEPKPTLRNAGNDNGTDSQANNQKPIKVSSKPDTTGIKSSLENENQNNGKPISAPTLAGSKIQPAHRFRTPKNLQDTTPPSDIPELVLKENINPNIEPQLRNTAPRVMKNISADTKKPEERPNAISQLNPITKTSPIQDTSLQEIIQQEGGPLRPQKSINLLPSGLPTQNINYDTTDPSSGKEIKNMIQINPDNEIGMPKHRTKSTTTVNENSNTLPSGEQKVETVPAASTVAGVVNPEAQENFNIPVITPAPVFQGRTESSQPKNTALPLTDDNIKKTSTNQNVGDVLTSPETLVKGKNEETGKPVPSNANKINYWRLPIETTNDRPNSRGPLKGRIRTETGTQPYTPAISPSFLFTDDKISMGNENSEIKLLPIDPEMKPLLEITEGKNSPEINHQIISPLTEVSSDPKLPMNSNKPSHLGKINEKLGPQITDSNSNNPSPGTIAFNNLDLNEISEEDLDPIFSTTGNQSGVMSGPVRIQKPNLINSNTSKINNPVKDDLYKNLPTLQNNANAPNAVSEANLQNPHTEIKLPYSKPKPAENPLSGEFFDLNDVYAGKSSESFIFPEQKGTGDLMPSEPQSDSNSIIPSPETIALKNLDLTEFSEEDLDPIFSTTGNQSGGTNGPVRIQKPNLLNSNTSKINNPVEDDLYKTLPTSQNNANAPNVAPEAALQNPHTENKLPYSKPKPAENPLSGEFFDLNDVYAGKSGESFIFPEQKGTEDLIPSEPQSDSNSIIPTPETVALKNLDLTEFSEEDLDPIFSTTGNQSGGTNGPVRMQKPSLLTSNNSKINNPVEGELNPSPESVALKNLDLTEISEEDLDQIFSTIGKESGETRGPVRIQKPNLLNSNNSKINNAVDSELNPSPETVAFKNVELSEFSKEDLDPIFTTTGNESGGTIGPARMQKPNLLNSNNSKINNPVEDDLYKILPTLQDNANAQNVVPEAALQNSHTENKLPFSKPESTENPLSGEFFDLNDVYAGKGSESFIFPELKGTGDFMPREPQSDSNSNIPSPETVALQNLDLTEISEEDLDSIFSTTGNESGEMSHPVKIQKPNLVNSNNSKINNPVEDDLYKILPTLQDNANAQNVVPEAALQNSHTENKLPFSKPEPTENPLSGEFFDLNDVYAGKGSESFIFPELKGTGDFMPREPQSDSNSNIPSPETVALQNLDLTEISEEDLDSIFSTTGNESGEMSHPVKIQKPNLVNSNNSKINNPVEGELNPSPETVALKNLDLTEFSEENLDPIFTTTGNESGGTIGPVRMQKPNLLNSNNSKINNPVEGELNKTLPTPQNNANAQNVAPEAALQNSHTENKLPYSKPKPTESPLSGEFFDLNEDLFSVESIEKLNDRSGSPVNFFNIPTEQPIHFEVDRLPLFSTPAENTSTNTPSIENLDPKSFAHDVILNEDDTFFNEFVNSPEMRENTIQQNPFVDFSPHYLSPAIVDDAALLEDNLFITPDDLNAEKDSDSFRSQPTTEAMVSQRQPKNRVFDRLSNTAPKVGSFQLPMNSEPETNYRGENILPHVPITESKKFNFNKPEIDGELGENFDISADDFISDKDPNKMSDQPFARFDTSRERDWQKPSNGDPSELYFGKKLNDVEDESYFTFDQPDDNSLSGHNIMPKLVNPPIKEPPNEVDSGSQDSLLGNLDPDIDTLSPQEATFLDSIENLPETETNKPPKKNEIPSWFFDKTTRNRQPANPNTVNDFNQEPINEGLNPAVEKLKLNSSTMDGTLPPNIPESSNITGQMDLPKGGIKLSPRRRPNNVSLKEPVNKIKSDDSENTKSKMEANSDPFDILNLLEEIPSDESGMVNGRPTNEIPDWFAERSGVVKPGGIKPATNAEVENQPSDGERTFDETNPKFDGFDDENLDDFFGAFDTNPLEERIPVGSSYQSNKPANKPDLLVDDLEDISAEAFLDQPKNPYVFDDVLNSLDQETSSDEQNHPSSNRIPDWFMKKSTMGVPTDTNMANDANSQNPQSDYLNTVPAITNPKSNENYASKIGSSTDENDRDLSFEEIPTQNDHKRAAEIPDWFIQKSKGRLEDNKPKLDDADSLQEFLGNLEEINFDLDTSDDGNDSFNNLQKKLNIPNESLPNASEITLVDALPTGENLNTSNGKNYNVPVPSQNSFSTLENEPKKKSTSGTNIDEDLSSGYFFDSSEEQMNSVPSKNEALPQNHFSFSNSIWSEPKRKPISSANIDEVLSFDSFLNSSEKSANLMSSKNDVSPQNSFSSPHVISEPKKKPKTGFSMDDDFSLDTFFSSSEKPTNSMGRENENTFENRFPPSDTLSELKKAPTSSVNIDEDLSTDYFFDSPENSADSMPRQNDAPLRNSFSHSILSEPNNIPATHFHTEKKKPATGFSMDDDLSLDTFFSSSEKPTNSMARENENPFENIFPSSDILSELKKAPTSSVNIDEDLSADYFFDSPEKSADSMPRQNDAPIRNSFSHPILSETNNKPATDFHTEKKKPTTGFSMDDDFPLDTVFSSSEKPTNSMGRENENSFENSFPPSDTLSVLKKAPTSNVNIDEDLSADYFFDSPEKSADSMPRKNDAPIRNSFSHSILSEPNNIPATDFHTEKRKPATGFSMDDDLSLDTFFSSSEKPTNSMARENENPFENIFPSSDTLSELKKAPTSSVNIDEDLSADYFFDSPEKSADSMPRQNDAPLRNSFSHSILSEPNNIPATDFHTEKRKPATGFSMDDDFPLDTVFSSSEKPTNSMARENENPFENIFPSSDTLSELKKAPTSSVNIDEDLSADYFFDSPEKSADSMPRQNDAPIRNSFSPPILSEPKNKPATDFHSEEDIKLGALFNPSEKPTSSMPSKNEVPPQSSFSPSSIVTEPKKKPISGPNIDEDLSADFFFNSLDKPTDSMPSKSDALPKNSISSLDVSTEPKTKSIPGANTDEDISFEHFFDSSEKTTDFMPSKNDTPVQNSFSFPPALGTPKMKPATGFYMEEDLSLDTFFNSSEKPTTSTPSQNEALSQNNFFHSNNVLREPKNSASEDLSFDYFSNPSEKSTNSIRSKHDIPSQNYILPCNNDLNKPKGKPAFDAGVDDDLAFFNSLENPMNSMPSKKEIPMQNGDPRKQPIPGANTDEDLSFDFLFTSSEKPMIKNEAPFKNAIFSSNAAVNKPQTKPTFDQNLQETDSLENFFNTLQNPATPAKKYEKNGFEKQTGPGSKHFLASNFDGPQKIMTNTDFTDDDRINDDFDVFQPRVGSESPVRVNQKYTEPVSKLKPGTGSVMFDTPSINFSSQGRLPSSRAEALEIIDSWENTSQPVPSSSSPVKSKMKNNYFDLNDEKPVSADNLDLDQNPFFDDDILSVNEKQIVNDAGTTTSLNANSVPDSTPFTSESFRRPLEIERPIAALDNEDISAEFDRLFSQSQPSAPDSRLKVPTPNTDFSNFRSNTPHRKSTTTSEELDDFFSWEDKSEPVCRSSKAKMENTNTDDLGNINEALNKMRQEWRNDNPLPEISDHEEVTSSQAGDFDGRSPSTSVQANYSLTMLPSQIPQKQSIKFDEFTDAQSGPHSTQPASPTSEPIVANDQLSTSAPKTVKKTTEIPFEYLINENSTPSVSSKFDSELEETDVSVETVTSSTGTPIGEFGKPAAPRGRNLLDLLRSKQKASASNE